MNDKQKRDCAVTLLASRMKERLDEKAEDGFHGWRNWPKRHLLRRIGTKLKKLEIGKDEEKHCVDIANLIMMVWIQLEDDQ